MNRQQSQIFDILSQYASNVFYVTIYESSKKEVRGDATLTDTYLSKVRKYIICLKTYPECYKYVIDNLYKAFLSSPGFSTSTFTRVVDKVVEQFVPIEYMDALSSTQKDELLSSIVCDLFAGLASYATKPDMLRKIIDEHAKSRTIILSCMMAEGSNILSTKRTKVYHLIIEENSQSKEFISNDIADDMRRRIEKLTEQNIALKREVLSKDASIRELEAERIKFLELISILKLSHAKKMAASVSHVPVAPVSHASVAAPVSHVSVAAASAAPTFDRPRWDVEQQSMRAQREQEQREREEQRERQERQEQWIWEQQQMREQQMREQQMREQPPAPSLRGPPSLSSGHGADEAEDIFALPRQSRREEIVDIDL